jgi:hypothetical protein
VWQLTPGHWDREVGGTASYIQFIHKLNLKRLGFFCAINPRSKTQDMRGGPWRKVVREELPRPKLQPAFLEAEVVEDKE